MSPFKEVRVGVAILLWHGEDSNDLLFHLRKGRHGPGTWSFPGGNMDPGEQPVETAVREFREEVGDDLEYISMDVYEPCPYVNTIFDTGLQYITLYFQATRVSGEAIVMEPDKNERWEWFACDQMPSPLFDPLEPDKLGLGQR